VKKYIALVEEDEGNYGVVFPDLPGVTSGGVNYLRQISASAGTRMKIQHAAEIFLL
jgi:hypothetical protein